MILWLFACSIVAIIAATFYDTNKKNKAQVLFGVAGILGLGFLIIDAQSGEPIDSSDLLGKVLLYVFASYIAIVIKDLTNSSTQIGEDSSGKTGSKKVEEVKEVKEVKDIRKGEDLNNIISCISDGLRQEGLSYAEEISKNTAYIKTLVESIREEGELSDDQSSALKDILTEVEEIDGLSKGIIEEFFIEEEDLEDHIRYSSSAIWVHPDSVSLEITPSKASSVSQRSLSDDEKETSRDVNAEEWSDLVDAVLKFPLEKWNDKEYQNLGVCDGEKWSLSIRIREKGIFCCAVGQNSYPADDGLTADYDESECSKFRELLDLLSDFSSGKMNREPCE
ncbi:hypothetical protein N8641_02785 [Akkermansiaceae bacterium]|nr:hypothetical protein [Akkermansiaceae bacterium]